MQGLQPAALVRIGDGDGDRLRLPEEEIERDGAQKAAPPVLLHADFHRRCGGIGNAIYDDHHVLLGIGHHIFPVRRGDLSAVFVGDGEAAGRGVAVLQGKGQHRLAVPVQQRGVCRQRVARHRLRQRYRQLASLPDLHSRAVGGGMVIPIRRIAHDVLPRRKPCDLCAGDGRIDAFICPAVLHRGGDAGELSVLPSGNRLIDGLNSGWRVLIRLLNREGRGQAPLGQGIAARALAGDAGHRGRAALAGIAPRAVHRQGDGVAAHHPRSCGLRRLQTACIGQHGAAPCNPDGSGLDGERARLEGDAVIRIDARLLGRRDGVAARPDGFARCAGAGNAGELLLPDQLARGDRPAKGVRVAFAVDLLPVVCLDGERDGTNRQRSRARVILGVRLDGLVVNGVGARVHICQAGLIAGIGGSAVPHRDAGAVCQAHGDAVRLAVIVHLRVRGADAGLRHLLDLRRHALIGQVGVVAVADDPVIHGVVAGLDGRGDVLRPSLPVQSVLHPAAGRAAGRDERQSAACIHRMQPHGRRAGGRNLLNRKAGNRRLSAERDAGLIGARVCRRGIGFRIAGGAGALIGQIAGLRARYSGYVVRVCRAVVRVAAVGHIPGGQHQLEHRDALLIAALIRLLCAGAPGADFAARGIVCKAVRMRRAHLCDFLRFAGIVRCAGDDQLLRAVGFRDRALKFVCFILSGGIIDMLGKDVQVIVRAQCLVPQVCGQGEGAAARLRGGGGGVIPLRVLDVAQRAVVEHGRVVAARIRLPRDQHGNPVDLLRVISSVVAIRVGHHHHAFRRVGDGLPGGDPDALAAVLQGHLVGRMRIGARLLHTGEEQDAGRLDVQRGADTHTTKIIR